MMSTSNRFKDILANEINNRNKIYLYLEGNTWCAYERSAYFLFQLHTPICLHKYIICEGSNVALLKVMFKVSDMQLPLSAKARLELVSDTDLRFGLKEMIGGFPEWKQQQLHVYYAEKAVRP
jgi:hypothetical protein